MTYFSIREALSSPRGFPTLSQTVFPGDRVLLAPDAEIATETAILAEMVQIFLETELAAEEITVLFGNNEQADSETLRTLVPEGVRILLHQPERRDRLAVLGVNDADEPIVLARELVDADMVFSVGRFRRRRSKGHFGLHSAIFPRFSDQETRLRFESAKDSQRRRLEAEVEEVARQLGVVFTMQLFKEKGRFHFVAGRPDLIADAFRDI